MPSPPDPRPSIERHGDFDVQSFSDTCHRLFLRGEHALLGVSAGNSYFSQQRIARLLAWAQQHFAAVDLLYVDVHIDTMHMASGCSREHAASRAARAVRDVRRRVRRAMEATAADPDRVRVRALSECADLPGYQAVVRRVDRDIATDERLRQACEEHVRHLLGPRPDPDGALLRAGLAYLRAELPFLVNTPDILGVPSSVVCYHAELPVLSRLYEGASCFHPRQRHVIIRPPE
jgi:cyclo(L-tyrosyl-L-tyrosyl) synthase